MEWIDVNKKQPKHSSMLVIVTDRKVMCLGSWIADPLDYYGKDYMDYDEDYNAWRPLDKKWHKPHWIFEKSIGIFISKDRVFGSIGDITHWMPFPNPPKE